MALMAVTAGTAGLDAHHAIGGVADALDVVLVARGEEAGPAGVALELGPRLEEGQAAEAAAIDPVLLVIQKTTAEGGLGAVMKQDLGLFAGQIGLQGLAFRRVGRCQIESGGGAGRGWHGHVVQSKVPREITEALRRRMRS